MDAAIYVERLIQDHVLRLETSERGQ